MRRSIHRSVLPAVALVALALAACSSSGGSPATSSGANSNGPTGGASAPPSSQGPASGNLTVWVDAARLPAAKAYVAAHPNVHVKVVTFDGDGNGAATLQTKIQLWNRTGSGWPDVIFSEQVNDPVWMAQSPFNFAAPVKGLLSNDILSKWPAASTAQCTINGTQYCVQDNLAQDVLWVNKKLMNQFHYQVPTTWQEWAALGQKAAAEHPGYIVGTTGESFSHWVYLWGDQCPLQQLKGNQVLINSEDSHCTRMASLLDPLIKDGSVPPLSVFTPDFVKKYGGANSKVLLMPGPAWYGLGVFQSTLHVPNGQITAAKPLQWGNETPVTTGQVGGGPWVISRHSQNMAAAADFVTWETTVFNPSGKDARPGYPAYEPLADAWLAQQAKNPFYASDPGPALKAAAGQIWPGGTW